MQQVNHQAKQHPIIWWTGTKTFVTNSLISGASLCYFAIAGVYPVALLIAILWICSLITWAEYRAALNGA